MQVSTFGIMPPVMVPSAIRRRASLTRQFLDKLLGLVEHARHVGQQQEALGLERAGDGAGEGVGIDVVGTAMRRGRDRRQHRDEFAAENLVEHHGVDLVRLADKAEVDHPLDVRIRDRQWCA